MTKKYIYQADGTVARVLHANPDDPFGDFGIETIEDVEPIVESVKALRDVQDNKSTMRHVARIPVTVIEQAFREGWLHDQAKWNQWLSDPDNRAFRVWEGNL